MSWFFAFLGMGGVTSTGGACGPVAVAKAVANGGAAPAAQGPPVEETIEKLRSRQETCAKSIDVLEKKIAGREKYLRENGKNPVLKQKCLQMLREKRMLEQDLKIQNANLDKFTATLAAISRNVDNADTIDALREANVALRAVQADPVLQEADAVMLSLEQAMERSGEADRILATPMKGSFMMDDTDLDQELASYDAQDAAAAATPEPVAKPARPNFNGPVPQPTMSSPVIASPPTAAAMYSNGLPTPPAATPSAKQPATADSAASSSASRMKELEQAVSV